MITALVLIRMLRLFQLKMTKGLRNKGFHSLDLLRLQRCQQLTWLMLLLSLLRYRIWVLLILRMDREIKGLSLLLMIVIWAWVSHCGNLWERILLAKRDRLLLLRMLRYQSIMEGVLIVVMIILLSLLILIIQGHWLSRSGMQRWLILKHWIVCHRDHPKEEVGIIIDSLRKCVVNCKGLNYFK